MNILAMPWYCHSVVGRTLGRYLMKLYLFKPGKLR